MSRFLRGMTGIFMCSMVFSTIGCAEDNEALVRAQAEANKLSDKTSSMAGARPSNPGEYYKQQQARQAAAFSRASGYPAPKTR